MVYMKYEFKLKVIYTVFSFALMKVGQLYYSTDFRKKTQSTPAKEINKALKIMKDYYENKKQ